MGKSSQLKKPALSELRKAIAKRRSAAELEASKLEQADGATAEGVIAHERAAKLRALAWDLMVLQALPDSCLRVQLENVAQFHAAPVLEGDGDG